MDDDVDIAGRTAKVAKVFLMTSNYNKTLQVPEGVTRVENFDDLAKKLNSVL